ncbi:hypothetical protein D1007_38268 [Hordeum vulgare]|nr:hypothetical protein D1007_38268 [Hordeum vulgare]
MPPKNTDKDARAGELLNPSGTTQRLTEGLPERRISCPPGTRAITSRLSLLKIGVVISKFSDFKKELVRETGFDGLMHIKSWQKINLKYSAYLMDRVDVENSIINLESQGMLELTDNQVHYVFGIPIGEHTIVSEGVDPSYACVEFTRLAVGISDKGTHSLKASEEYLNRDITVDSRKIDKDCFKIAFVIFVVGHALAPSAKHDYIEIDFWSALNDVTKIKEWNWCRYLLSHMFQAGVYPRIALFDYDSMKKMVDAISVNMGGGEISYHRSSVRREQNVSKELVCVVQDDPANNFPRPSPTPKRAQFTSAPVKRASYTKTGPLEFANHIRTKYPTISGEKLGMILNEHNARGLAHISEMRRSFQSTMFNFVDKLVSCIADNCTCCKAFGSYSGDSSNARKRNCVMGSSNAIESQKKICVSPNEPIQVRTPSDIDILNNSSISAKDDAHNQVADIVYSFFDDLAASSVSYYAELRPSSTSLLELQTILCRVRYDYQNVNWPVIHGQLDQYHSPKPNCYENYQGLVPSSCTINTRKIEAESQTCFIILGYRYNYGAGTTFLAWNFDGEKFQIPVMKDNLERHKNWVLYEVMRTDGNKSMIPSDAIEAIKGSFLAL